MDGALSRERAASVAELLRTSGISPNRMTIDGLGAAQPLTSNLTLDERRANRRADVWGLPREW